jgi:hypothetical protein
MSTAYQASKAAGTKAQCRAGKVRHTVTLDQALFQIIKSAAIDNRRSVSEEMSVRLQLSPICGVRATNEDEKENAAP